MISNEFCAFIKHFYLKGLTPKEIKARLNEVNGISLVFGEVSLNVAVHLQMMNIVRTFS